jgi:hypothetical protein
MKTWVLTVLMGFGAFSSYAYLSGIAIQSDKHATMQVTVNGKVFNKTPESFVRIKSQPGLFRLELKILNPTNKVWYVVREQIRVEKGLEFYYKVEFNAEGKPVLKLVKQYPVYTKYFLNPSMYNKHPIT